ncbi:rubrerythrin-like domain-containing protein [Haladaptatus pallidirubidus]|nr:rubrerythrin-like domain-containing protein [Haladaptatus pallidirubidus]
MRDVQTDPNEERPYECFACGNIIINDTNPGACPDCSNPMRNRQMPIE